MRPWRLAELTYAEVKQREYEVAVIPLGCTEPHNLHLPYGTDTLEAGIIGDHICESACNSGAKVALLPTIPYGTVTNQRACPLAINVNPSTLFALLTDLIDSLENHGIHKIVLLNSHGGNELKPLLRELFGTRRAQVFVCNWYECVRDIYDEVFEEPEDHAGEMETSLAMAYFAERQIRPAVILRKEQPVQSLRSRRRHPGRAHERLPHAPLARTEPDQDHHPRNQDLPDDRTNTPTTRPKHCRRLKSHNDTLVRN